MSTEVLVTTARRSWPMELKRQILDEAERPGSSICSVAKAYNVDPAQLYQWRKKFRGGQVATDTGFIPVEIGARPADSGGNDPVEAPRRDRAELAFPNGVHLFFSADLDRALMDRLIAAVLAS